MTSNTLVLIYSYDMVVPNNTCGRQTDSNDNDSYDIQQHFIHLKI